MGSIRSVLQKYKFYSDCQKTSTNPFNIYKKYYLCSANGSVAQLNRASDYGSEGWGFDSLRGHRSKS